MVSSVDVARMAGVSRTAVSRVLNGHADARISAATQTRIWDCARQLGYVANAAARSLATGKTQRVSIITAGPGMLLGLPGYFGLLLQGILGRALEHGYDVLLHGRDGADWESHYRALRSCVADGALLIARGEDDPLTNQLAADGIPAVAISIRPTCGLPYVDCDNFEGGRIAAQHLLEAGCSRIITLGVLHPFERQRLEGVREIAGDRYVGNLTSATKLERRFRRNSERVGVIALHEDLGIDAVAALNAQGIRAPDDYALLVFSDTEYSLETDPPLTAVRQDLHQVGAKALALLLQHLNAVEEAPPFLIAPMKLVVRQSTVRP